MVFLLPDCCTLAPGLEGGGDGIIDLLFFLGGTALLGVVLGDVKPAENFACGSIPKYVESVIPSVIKPARASANVMVCAIAYLNSL